MRHRLLALPLALVCALATFLAAPSSSTDPADRARAVRPPALSAAPATPLQDTVVVLRTRLPTRFKRPARLQARLGGTWRTIAQKRTGADGRVVFRPRSLQRTSYRVEAKRVVHRGKRHARVTSKVRVVTPRPRTTLVSAAPHGTSADASVSEVRLSGDGRWIVYTSDATNLVAGDTNAQPDVFLRDRVTGTTVVVSDDRFGGPSDGGGSKAEISRDGRYVVFASTSTDLVEDDTNGVQDVFRWERATGLTELVSDDILDGPTNGASYDPEVSADGSRVLFQTAATDILIGDDNNSADMYVWNAPTDGQTLVNQAAAGGRSDSGAFLGRLSADGRVVAYSSTAVDQVDPPSNGERNVFRRDLDAGTTQLVSHDPDGDPLTTFSNAGALSDDGRFVAFSTNSAAVLPGGNTTYDLFLWDSADDTYDLVSHRRGSGAEGNGYSYWPSAISGNAAVVVFNSAASDLVRGDTNGVDDVFSWTRSTGVITRITHDRSWQQINGGAFDPVRSADGAWIAFTSRATDLVPGAGGSDVDDAFLFRNTPTPVTP